MEIDINIDEEVPDDLDPAWLKKIIQATLAYFNQIDVHIGLNICSPADIQALNRRYRQKDRVTNVLSFPMREGPHDLDPELGDIVLCWAQAKLEAQNEAKSLNYKIAELIIHSILHLMGHHHDTPAQEKQIFHKTDTVLDILAKQHLLN